MREESQMSHQSFSKITLDYLEVQGQVGQVQHFIQSFSKMLLEFLEVQGQGAHVRYFTQFAASHCAMKAACVC